MRRPELTPIQIEANRRWWLNDLRSKAFEQGNSALRIREPDMPGVKHCCLGVACESYRAATTLGGWTEGSAFDEFTDDAGEHNSITIEGSDVARWLNLDAELESKLIDLNDAGRSFNVIATTAEKAWKMGRYA